MRLKEENTKLENAESEVKEKKSVKSKKTYDESVVRPSHYNAGRYETIDVINDILSSKKNISPTTAYAVGTAIKYLSRMGLKNPDELKGQTLQEKAFQDLSKSIFYLCFAALNERGYEPIKITERVGEIIKILESN